MIKTSKILTGTIASALAIAGATFLLTGSSPTYKIVAKNNDGGWYYPNGKARNLFNPGDTVIMEGDYAYVNLDSVIGTVDKPIVFIHKPGQITRVGTNNSYGWILTHSKYVVIDGMFGDTVKYGFKIGGPTQGQYIAQSMTFPTSDNLEIKGVELLNAQVGFFANPKTGSGRNYSNIKIHDVYVHDLNNPAESGRCESVYIGRTDTASAKGDGSFNNLQIWNFIAKGLYGDGIQIALASNVHVWNVDIDGYGRANLEQQRSAIIVGGCTNGVFENIKVRNGTGSPFQVFGGGDIYFKNCRADSVATSLNEDGFYLDGKCLDGKANVHLINDTIIGKVNRDYIRNVNAIIIENTGNYFSLTAPVVVVPPPPPIDSVYLFKGGYATDPKTLKRVYFIMYSDHKWITTNSKYQPL